MSIPYSVREQHRDFLIVIGFALLAFAFAAEIRRLCSHGSDPKWATIFVDGMCCQRTAEPAVHALTKVGGILEAQPNFQEKTIRLELRKTRTTSPLSIWEAVEKSSLRPKQLVVAGRIFNTRPVE